MSDSTTRRAARRSAGLVPRGASMTMAMANSLDGPGTIVAVGNADTKSDGSYQGDHRALYQGRALVIIRTSHKPGTIHLRAAAEGMAPAEINLESKPAQSEPSLDR